MLPGIETISLPADLSEFTHIIDVRSPGEYTEDHIPGAINLPALSNEQRAEVGTLDKQVSPFAARKLGARYITENISRHLEAEFADFGKDFTPLVYCWRGGMRSGSFATILRAIGWRAHIIQGGYKAYRTHVISEINRILSHDELQLHTLSGLTGTGKTRLLHQLANDGQQVLDLEGLANHKGSLLGATPDSPQPSQRLFETRLLSAIQKCDFSKPVWTEAESNRIGKLQCPPALWQALGQSIVYQVRLPIENRAELLKEDYPHFLDHSETLCDILDRLRRLRGNDQIDSWQQQVRSKDWTAFLQSILLNHYDLSYRKPGEKSNYPDPSFILEVNNHKHEAMVKGAQDLISLACS